MGQEENPYTERLQKLEEQYSKEASPKMRKKIGAEYKKLKQAEEKWKSQSIKRTDKKKERTFDINKSGKRRTKMPPNDLMIG